jgi:N6-adenosine-specific RNA methylase IME4
MYNVIYADPPWNIKAGRLLGKYKTENGSQVWNIENNKSRDLPYKTMSVEDIKALPVQNITNKDACLFIWVTNSHLPHIFDIINSWGFSYSTTLVWAKNALGGGLGGTFRITTEFLIYAKKGIVPIKTRTIGTCFNVKRTYVNGYPKHSLKPEFFRDLIEKTVDGPYLELFARSESKNWDVFGNEVPNSIVL